MSSKLITIMEWLNIYIIDVWGGVAHHTRPEIIYWFTTSLVTITY